MRCQQCEKPATFHITELTDDEPQELHLCEDHARQYLAHSETPELEPPKTLAGALADHLKVGQTTEELSQLDKQSCPVCGITFYEFRSQGRLGCPHDYECFAEELEPLMVNIHGDTVHKGKRPKRQMPTMQETSEMIKLRRQMKEAVENEDYEMASLLRDKLKQLDQVRPEREPSDDSE